MKIGFLLLLAFVFAARADGLAALCADRIAVERVYYNHRLGDKPPFEQSSPPSLIDRLVKEDLRKEAVLKKSYGVAVTLAMLETEVQRINTTTRAPEILAELKTALGNDPARFARTVAKPIMVERCLRERFDNDDKLHADLRRQAERTRNELLAAKTNGADCEKLLALLKRGYSNSVTETTWQLGPRPDEINAPTAGEMEIKKRFGPNAQIVSSPQAGEKDARVYFGDLPAELQRVMGVQLRQIGDVSTVIETPGGLLVYLCKERTAQTLSVAALSLPKRSYEQWLNEQNETKL
jgi:hypothetical protein